MEYSTSPEKVMRIRLVSMGVFMLRNISHSPDPSLTGADSSDKLNFTLNSLMRWDGSLVYG